MSTLILVVLEIMLCLGISLVLIWLIKSLLCDILIETCGTQKRAEFWVMFTQLMLVISPLLLVIYFVPTADATTINVAKALKDTLFRTLLGDFIALASIGQVIWKSIKYSSIDNNIPVDTLNEP
jgi:hypothetical protein